MSLNFTYDRKAAVRVFDSVLNDASKRVEEKFFTFRMANHTQPVPRERVYCYELYHQLRMRWPPTIPIGVKRDALAPFTLNGEVDKAGHSAFDLKDRVKRVKPDFIVHVPESMEYNLISVEVKSWSASFADLHKDIEQLVAMMECANYHCGFLLVFGPSDAARKIAAAIVEADSFTEYRKYVDAGRLRVYLHDTPGQPAQYLNPRPYVDELP